MATALASSAALAQSHNVGYYVFDSYDGDNTVYRLVYSIYVPGVENEPSQPGDIAVTWGGGESDCGHDPLTGGDHCIASTQTNPTLQPQPFTLTDPDLHTQSGGEVIDEVVDRIVVVGRLIRQNVGVVFLRWDGIEGLYPAQGTFRETEALPKDLAPPDEAEACTPEKLGDMGGILDTQEKREMVAAYMNSQMAQNMWDESNFRPGVMTGRMEQVGVSYPDGTMERIATFNSSVCGAQTEAFPTLFDTGAILGHTQPMTRGENSPCEDSQGQTYGNRPSREDVDFFNDKGADLGLIIDADGITIFTPDYDPNDGLDSPEVQHKGDHDGDEDAKYGVTR